MECEAKLAAAIRQGAPANTIIAAGARWDDDDDMVFLEPLRDPNVIYVFHFYEPHIFTHQGATWGAYYWTLAEGPALSLLAGERGAGCGGASRGARPI